MNLQDKSMIPMYKQCKNVNVNLRVPYSLRVEAKSLGVNVSAVTRTALRREIEAIKAGDPSND